MKHLVKDRIIVNIYRGVILNITNIYSLNILSKEPVKSFPGMFKKMKISLYDN